MKKTVLFMMTVCFVATYAWASDVKFKVNNMHCGGCAARVQKTLKVNDAVSDVKVNLETKMVTVTYDETKTDANTLQEALKNAKFEVEAVKAGGCCGDKKTEGKGNGGCCKKEKTTQK